MALQNKMKNTTELTPPTILKKIKKKIVFHNFFVQKYENQKRLYILILF